MLYTNIATIVFYFLPGDIKLPRPLRPPPTALLRFLRTPPATFVTLPAVVLPAFVILPAVALPAFDILPAVALPAFDILPAVALPAFDIALAPVLFIMLPLPEEVMLVDFILELPLVFPVEAAPSTEEAEPALASIVPIDKARATPKTLDTIFVIGHREHTYALILSGLKYERGFRKIVALGGDGTINEVANGFFEEISLGNSSGNDQTTPAPPILKPINPEAMMGRVPSWSKCTSQILRFA